MQPPIHVPPLAAIGLLALIAWRLVARVRRLVGRQRLSRVRPWLSVCLFPLLIVSLLVGTYTHPARALADLAGVALGVVLAYYGLKHTRFEATPEGLYYTPNAHIGIALSVMFAGRILYRALQVYSLPEDALQSPETFVRSPLTMLMVGVIAGYYAAYAFGLLRWRHGVEHSRT